LDLILRPLSPYLRHVSAIVQIPGGARLLALSILARLPLTMFSIALLVHAKHVTGSFAAGGLVTGAYAVSVGVGGPLLGALVDRRGQTVVLTAAAGIVAALLGVLALLPVGTPLAAIVALAAGAGLATPPLGACFRTVVPELLGDPEAVRAAYAFDASAEELTWVSGPPLALGLGALWSTGAALAVGGALLLVATAAFAAQPASRAWRPAALAPRPRGGSLGTPAMRTLVIILIAIGFLFGAVEVAVTAAAQTLHAATAAAPLFALWGAGSLAGGLIAARLRANSANAAGLLLLLGALSAGHLLLIAAAGSAYALGLVLLVAGAAIAPTYATVYANVERAAPPGTVTEAFAWLETAVAVGSAFGAATAGAVVDSAGPAGAFALAGAAGVLAVLIAALRRQTLSPSPAAVPVPAC
jgi:MFS family permease